jgi:hypothetical protein
MMWRLYGPLIVGVMALAACAAPGASDTPPPLAGRPVLLFFYTDN